MAHPVNFFQISAADGGPLQAFYQKVFTWKMSAAPGGPMMMVEPEKGGIAGGVGSSQNGASSVAIYVGVDDVSAHLRTVEQAGGSTAMEPMDLPAGMGKIAGFLDPAGNWIGLWQAPPQPAKPARAKAKKPAKRAAPKKAAPKAAKKPAKKRKR
jgi:uncharacterized protein